VNVRRVEKPWGHELIWAETDRYVGKILHINAGQRLSLQYHEKKDETIFVLTGEMELVVGSSAQNLQTIVLKMNESYHIIPKTIHRMVAISDCDLVEVSTPELLDVVRLQDDFGRQGTFTP